MQLDLQYLNVHNKFLLNKQKKCIFLGEGRGVKLTPLSQGQSQETIYIYSKNDNFL